MAANWQQSQIRQDCEHWHRTKGRIVSFSSRTLVRVSAKLATSEAVELKMKAKLAILSAGEHTGS